MAESAEKSGVPSYRELVGLAWPVILANAAVPLLGLVDTAVMGRTGSAVDLGAIALGALIFSGLTWAFGFLRMSTTGFIAQARGAADATEVRAVFGRALLVAGVIGTGLLGVHLPLINGIVHLFGAGETLDALATSYLRVRFWGAPATLALFVLNGVLIGLGRTRELLILQVGVNVLNAGLDIAFAVGLGWGARGIAAGTVCAEVCALLGGLILVGRILQAGRKPGEAFWPLARIRQLAEFGRAMGANADIMIRTVALLGGFAWFTYLGTQRGPVVLAANHILLQFISLAAFFLDGIAFTTESLVGQAVGARDPGRLDAVVRRTSVLAVLTAVALAGLLAVGGGPAIRALTDLPEVRVEATGFLGWAVLYVAISVAAFQLDGVFIGATRTRAMRNASIVAGVLFVGSSWWLVRFAGNDGLWAAFVAYVGLRAVTLAVAYPCLRNATLSSGPRDADLART